MKNTRNHETSKYSTLKRVAELMDEIESKIDTFSRFGENDLTTGFPTLDARIGGLRAGELGVVVGDKGIGVREFLISVLKHCIHERPMTPILLLAERNFDVALSLACSYARIHPAKYKLGCFGINDRQRFLEATATIKKAPLFFNDCRADTIDELCTAARTMKDMLGLGLLLIVDSFQHIRDDHGPQSFKLRQINIGRKLRSLANELDIPVICTATLSLKKGNHTIRMGALRAEGIPVSEADLVLCMSEDKKERQWRRKYDDCTSSKTVNVEILKPNGQPGGRVQLFWDEQTHVLEERTEETAYNYEPFFPEDVTDESPSF